MTKEELAAALSGNQYGREISDGLADQAKAYGLVVVFGASDDLMEFRGAIEDEVGAWEGGSAYIADGALFDESECDSACKYFQAAKARATEIKALWCKEKPYSWTYETTIPHATFDIVEGDEKHCRGIVFELKDAS